MTIQTLTKQDSFTQLREVFNGNFSTLTEAVEAGCSVVLGTFSGNGATTRHIELGFRPRAVLLERSDGARGNGNTALCGLFLDGYPIAYGDCCKVDDTGFSLDDSHEYANVNRKNETYYYIALK